MAALCPVDWASLPVPHRPLIKVSTMTAYAIDTYRHGSEVPAAVREQLLAEINATIATNWNYKTPHWTMAHSPFVDDFGIILSRAEGKLSGYAFYKRLTIDGQRVIYRAGAEVARPHQRAGLYRMMTTRIFGLESLGRAGAPDAYLAWRTRNPNVWIANARLCSKVVPSLRDGVNDADMQRLCVRAAEAIYPKASLEVPSMIMRNAYPHMAYHRQQTHPSDRVVNDWFAASIPATPDSVLSLGLIKTAGSPQ